MRTREEYSALVAEILKDLRASAHLSKAKMADKLNVDERTYSRYESGAGAPTLADFLAMLDAVDAPALPTILRHLYPECYTEPKPDAATEELRRSLSNYILNIATDRQAQQLAYIIFGQHGSPLEAQMQLFSAVDHLQMDVRLMIAKLTLNAWEIESIRGGVINPDIAGPDIELLRQAIIKATVAVVEGRNSYIAATK